MERRFSLRRPAIRSQESPDVVGEQMPRGRQPRRWAGRFFLDAGRALYVGKVFETTRHAHHAIQVCVGLEAPVRLRAEGKRRWQPYSAAIIRADVPHELAGDGRTMGLLFIEPESRDGRRLELASGRAVVALASGQASRLQIAMNRAASTMTGDLASADITRELLAILGCAGSRPREVHPHLSRALALLEERGDVIPGSVGLANLLGLSADRFRHLFVREIGLTYRRYRLWLRLKMAAEEAGRGTSLTDAAHAAGFSDSAHLTRTFRQMFGITPSSAPRILETRERADASTERARRTGSR